jgi:uncharacterized membrane protein
MWIGTDATQQLSRAGGMYAIAAIFSISAKAEPDTWAREMWWILFVLANLPACWLVYWTQFRKK